MSNALVQTRINQQIKEEASVVLASIGMTVSDAVRLLLTRVAQEKKLPFEPLVPNEETIQAMKEARTAKNLSRYRNIDDAFEALNA